jgi:hypothetical protein
MFREAMRHPRIARLFAHVHVLFWPWLWLQLRALARWHAENGRPEVMLSVSRWGRLTVIHTAPPEALPHPFRPLARYISRMTHLPVSVMARLSALPPARRAGSLRAAVWPQAFSPRAPAFDTS